MISHDNPARRTFLLGCALAAWACAGCGVGPEVEAEEP